MDLRSGINRLYNGQSKPALVFRYGLLVFDICTVAFFVISTLIAHGQIFLVLDYFIAIVLTLDFLARLWISRAKWRFLMQPITWADIVVIITLLAPAFLENFAFLRVMRVLRLLRSYHVLRDLRGRYNFFKRNEQIIQSVLNLMVFIFFITALVYVLQVNINPNIENYIDALYFTVTTLTTTGFGDITLQGDTGHMLSVIIMVFGISLFLRLVQTIFRPQKVNYKCPTCGLKQHDPDAIHCKHCGEAVKIETDGL